MAKIDGHVHIVGDGSSGSGCWLTIKTPWQRLLAYIMVKSAGLLPGDLKDGLDRLYVERLLEQVRASSLDAILILANELPHDENGKVLEGKGSFYVPNDYILELARQHPEFIPAVSIHPARPDALEELERCLEAGVRVMKCLPNCQNINCADKRYSPFWERMAEARMILLAHTGGELAVPVLRADYADPRILQHPLECGVTVIAAHCGTRCALVDPDYSEVFLNMLQTYPNLYGDNSAFNNIIKSKYLKKILPLEVTRRIVHGSDYPIPVSGLGPWLHGHLDWRQYRRWQKHSNVIERDYQFKRAMGFPDDTFTRLDSLLGN